MRDFSVRQRPLNLVGEPAARLPGVGQREARLSQKGGLPCHAAGRTFGTVQGHRLAHGARLVAALTIEPCDIPNGTE